MIIHCQNCGTGNEIPSKEILREIEGSPELQKLTGSALGKIYSSRAKPENQKRSPEICRKAQQASVKKRRENKNL